MEFKDYQDQAVGTFQLPIDSNVGRVELVLGLASEAGGVARIYKRLLRDKVTLNVQRPQLIDGLGDVLWYVAMIAKSVGLELDAVAARNLERTRDRYPNRLDNDLESSGADFDSSFPPTERFPDRMVFLLRHTEKEGMPHVEFSLVQAEPNAFPNGADTEGKKRVGFTLGRPIGDVVNDNAAREDGYRFHDAVHIAFMTVLGWSPVMRGLLRLKRKSNPDIDRIQDGARARDLEEALSAILFELSMERKHFATEVDIDGEVRDVIRRVISNLEVAAVPVHRWANAIWQGYRAMNELMRNNGGYILADRKLGIIEFHATEPKL